MNIFNCMSLQTSFLNSLFVTNRRELGAAHKYWAQAQGLTLLRFPSVTGFERGVSVVVAWVHLDGSLASLLPFLGCQPDRKSRNAGTDSALWIKRTTQLVVMYDARQSEKFLNMNDAKGIQRRWFFLFHCTVIVFFQHDHDERIFNSTCCVRVFRCLYPDASFLRAR